MMVDGENYSSNMTISRSNRYSMLDNVDEDEKYQKKEYCQRCLKLQILIPLGERCYPDLKPDDPLPSDHEKWRQCPRCGSVFMLQYVKRESRLVPAHGYIPESPAEMGLAHVVSVHSRDKNQRETRFQKRQREAFLAQIKDDDAKRLMRKGDKLTSYYQNDDTLEQDFINAKTNR